MEIIKKLAAKGVIKRNDKVVVILTAHGAKFSKAVIDYHKGKKGKFSNPPKIINANLKAVENALGLKS